MKKNFKKISRYMLLFVLFLSFLLASVPLGSLPVFVTVSAADLSTISISSNSQAARGIDVNSGFIVSGDRSITKSVIENHIEFTPEIEYSISEQDDGTYLIKPLKPLEGNSIVNLSVKDDKGRKIKEWAYQTENDFKILSTFPLDGSENVRCNSGIEIKFSQMEIDLESFKAAFKIEPMVEGTFQQFRNTVVFMPKKLSEDTVYKITIDKSVKNSFGEELKEGVEFSFCTEYSHENIFYYDSFITYNYLETDTPFINLNVYYDYIDEVFKTKLYKFKSSNDYLNQLKAFADCEFYSHFIPDLSNAKEQLTIEDKPYILENYAYVLLPELTKGWYATETSIKINNKEYKIYKLIQITDFAVYATLNGHDGLIWVNSTVSGKSVADATVEVIGKTGSDIGKTNNDGTAVIKWKDSKDTNNFKFLKIQKDNETYIDLVKVYDNAEFDKYYKYIYTDREMYLPTEKIKVWGVVKPRSKDIPFPDNLKIALTDWYNSIYEIPIKLDSNGTFTCDIPISSLQRGWYTIDLIENDKIIEFKSIEIADYKKPVYSLSSETDKEIYTDPEENPIKVKVRGSLFEGSPCSSFPMTSCKLLFSMLSILSMYGGNEPPHIQSTNVCLSRS